MPDDRPLAAAPAEAATADALIVLKWAGVAYLLWMAYRTFRAPPPNLATGGRLSNTGMTFARRGFITSASNPKAVFFFAALFPQFIDAGLPIWPQLFILGATYLAIDGVILVLYGAIAERSVARFQGGRVRRAHDKAVGLRQRRQQ